MHKNQSVLSHVLVCLRGFIPIFLLLLFHALYINCIVSGPSMEPTLHQYDYVFGVRHPASITVGDIIMLRAPDRDDGALYVKRVAAVGGDTISISDIGTLVITHADTDCVEQTDYKVPYDKIDVYPITLSQGQIYVFGDNKTNSNDSRNFGGVSTDNIVAKAVFSLPANPITQALAKIRF